jgi:septum formation protein
MMHPGSPLWLAAQPLLLASRSAGRRALLHAAGIPVETRPAEIDERAAEDEARAGGADARGVALALAAAKAEALAMSNPARIVLGADQTLDLGGDALHKPMDRAHATEQLRRLSGRNHHLHSAVCLRQGERILLHDAVTATLLMRPLGEVFLDAYVAAVGDTILSSVGCYQLEGLGIHLFERIDGDHSTVVGLPMLPLLAALRRHGLVLS